MNNNMGGNGGNPMEQMMQQMFAAIFGGGDPLQNMQSVAQNDSHMAQVLRMSNNGNIGLDQMINVCRNVANQRGINFGQIEFMMNNLSKMMPRR